MSLGNIGPAGGEGSRGQVGTSTSLAADQPDTTKYHFNGKETIIPHRLNDDGRSPGFDPASGLSQFQVVDVDTTPNNAQPAVQHEPGALDRYGLPVQKDSTCLPTPSTTPSTSPTSQTDSTSDARTSTDTPPARSRGSRRSASLPAELLALSKRVDELARQCETLRQTLPSLVSPLGQSLLDLTAKLDSLTSSSLSRTPSESSRLQTADGGWQLEFRGQFGRMRVPALAIDLRSENQLLVLFDPERPYFVPAASDEPIDVNLKNAEYDIDLQVRPNGWSAPLMIGQQDCLLMIMSLVS